MKRKQFAAIGIMLGIIGMLLTGCSFHKTKIAQLKVNYRMNPIGIDDDSPYFSWQMVSKEQGKSQTAYQILVADSPEKLDKKDYAWDSGKVESDLSVAIPYEGEELQTRTRYYWKVRVWDERQRVYTSTEPSFFETGLMNNIPEEVHWISAPSIRPEIAYTDVTEYEIDYTMEIQDTKASFAFGATQGRYGSMTLCEIQSQGGQAFFRVKDMMNLNMEQIEFPCAEIPFATDSRYHAHLQIKKQQMMVWINDNEVGTFNIQSNSLGAIGYYKSRGVDYGYLDDVLVRDETGNLCYEEDFESADSIFYPHYVQVVDGKLKMGSGLMLSGMTETPAPVFRKEFQLQDKAIEKARVYMTSLGNFQMSINGQNVTDDFLTPGKLLYNQYLSYVTYDVTDLLRKGADNAIGITLFHGWYDRGTGYPEIYNPWGEKNALYGAVIVTYEDGSEDVVGTDELFRVYMDGPIRENDMYQGEFYDATKKVEEFDQPGYESDYWENVEVDKVDDLYREISIVAKENEPISCIEEKTPVSVTEPVAGTYVYDFGQNFAGVCHVKLNTSAGTLVTMRYAETLNTEELQNKDDVIGTIWTENLLTADATDYYISVEGEQVYEPVSVYHGFRYLQITGLDEAPAIEDVTGIVLSSKLQQTGSFECSNELVNRYFQNALWSQRSNFFDNPTDCAQRDERHGWAGDAQIFSNLGCYNSNCYSFYKKYLTELQSLQTEDGAYPDMVPRSFGTDTLGTGGAGGNNCWGDAAVVLTWNLYQHYGDRRLLEENYEGLCRWVDFLDDKSINGLQMSETGYGDHLALESTPRGLTDTAWSAYSAKLVSQISMVLGQNEKAAHYEELSKKFRDAWLAEYVSEDGVIECYSQTAYALGIAFDLFPEEMRKIASECLQNNITFNQYEFHAGYAGLEFVFPALSEMGCSETAYQMLINTEQKTLLFPVTKGATTTCESLYTYTETEGQLLLDGSLNHGAYGAPAEWLYTNVLGIQSDVEHPGFKHFFIKPEVSETFTYARGSYDSMYGRIEVSWESQQNGYLYNIKIPGNTTATVVLPGMDMMELTSGTYQFHS